MGDVPILLSEFSELFQHGLLRYASRDSSIIPVSTMLFSLCIHSMRNILADDISIGVIGTGNVGKSSWMNLSYGFETNPSALVRTVDIKPYYQRRREHIHFLDFPHSNSTNNIHRDIFQTSSKFIDLAIVVMDVRRVDQDEKSLVRILRNRSVFDYVICLNCCDTLIHHRPRGGRRKGAESSQIVACSKEDIERLRLEHARNLRVDESKVLMCSFDPEGCTADQLAEQGIVGVEYIRDVWVSRMLRLHTRFTE